MIIRCYGARGSIPVSGEEYNKFGGDTTCLEVRTKRDEIIIVDAGSGIRRLGQKLLKEKRMEYNFIFTHSHWDHIMGFPFFRPLYDKEVTVNIMGCPTAQGNLKTLLSRAMSKPFFPVPFEELKAKINFTDVACGKSFYVDSVEIFFINLSHPNGGMGYRFEEDGKSFVFLTDNELGFKHRNGRDFKEYAEFARDADILVHDAEYTPEEYKVTRSWGHSTYIDAVHLAMTAEVKRFGLFHHNQDRNDADQERLVHKSRNIIESKSVEMKCFALTQTTELIL
ncbi:MAG: MBL fold metallo-hydrolase [Thermodesulfobacteriota bacterium]|nr:MBL fold metallo-hydrolase [Thermodesulfobacteriota bacterium]